jgi:glycosyltransferase involved in cell wall biosynthesis
MTCFVMTDGASRESVKVSCQLADALAACGVHCVMVTPDGMAPQWFQSSVAFAAEAQAFRQTTASDTVVVSAPRDVERIAALPARRVFHAQGTTAALDDVIDDPSITVLACWPATAAVIRQRTGRDPIEVGIAVADVFFQMGVRRVAGTLAFTPRASAVEVDRCVAVPQIAMVPIEVIDDLGVAAILQASEFYLAPEGDGGCGIEILEALAAGCVVIGTSRSGAGEILDGSTGIIAGEHDLCTVLLEWSAPAARIRRTAVRDRGRALAAAYRLAALRRRIAALLTGPLAFVRS